MPWRAVWGGAARSLCSGGQCVTLASQMALESLPGREWRCGQVEERPSRVMVLFRTPPGIHEEVRTVGNRVGVGGFRGGAETRQTRE